MGEGGEKKIVVPSGLEHFVADARRTWRCLQGIDGQLADDGEIFGGVILAAAAGVLVEQDVENPVQVVLDAPVGAHGLEQFLGRQQPRSQKVSGRVLGSLAVVGAPTVDAADGTILMGAYRNEESLRMTLALGEAVYYSLSRKEIWHKGNTSPCDPYPGIRFLNAAYAKEVLKGTVMIIR